MLLKLLNLFHQYLHYLYKFYQKESLINRIHIMKSIYPYALLYIYSICNKHNKIQFYLTKKIEFYIYKY